MGSYCLTGREFQLMMIKNVLEMDGIYLTPLNCVHLIMARMVN